MASVTCWQPALDSVGLDGLTVLCWTSPLYFTTPIVRCLVQEGRPFPDRGRSFFKQDYGKEAQGLIN